MLHVWHKTLTIKNTNSIPNELQKNEISRLLNN